MREALDPFFTTKDVGKGTGLGLPLVYGIVRGHNGYLDIRTTPGVGTCMSLYLPCTNSPAPATPPATAATATDPGPSRHILVIDDEISVQEIIARALHLAGHYVTCLGSGAAGVEWLRQQQDEIDLVILDWLIPKENGLATLKKIRMAKKNLPILIATGYMPEDQVQGLRQEGAAGILRKPFSIDDLWQAVRQALAG
jgi:two-component system cell cycle sensor histidine kinase/response regulator CckA